MVIEFIRQEYAKRQKETCGAFRIWERIYLLILKVVLSTFDRTQHLQSQDEAYYGRAGPTTSYRIG